MNIEAEAARPWQAELCQFFTRDKVAELCLRQVAFPKNLLTVRLLEPAAGLGAFFLPLLPRLVQACRQQKKSFDLLQPIISAYEIDARVALILRQQTAIALEDLGVSPVKARYLARISVNNSGFSRSPSQDPVHPHHRQSPLYSMGGDSCKASRGYKARFSSFKKRAA